MASITNVITQYDWCSLPRDSPLRKDTPSVAIKSFKLTSNNLTTVIEGYINIAKNAGKNADTFYKGMYAEVAKEEDVFIFPYFSDELRSFGNTFGDTFQSATGTGAGIGSGVNDIAKTALGLAGDISGLAGFENLVSAANKIGGGKVANALSDIGQGIMEGGDAGSYIETPMFYQYEKNDGPLNISFILSNTLNSDSITKNYELVKKLTKINRPLRKNGIAIEPPRIYKVKLTGQRFMEWAYCSSFSVSMLGTKRMVSGIVTPEAYQINMAFQSLTLEHAGFMDKTK